MSQRDSSWWRRDRVELVIAELEPVIAIEEKYPHGGPDAAQVQERQPKRMKEDKSGPILEWVDDASTVILESTIVVLCRGI